MMSDNCPIYNSREYDCEGLGSEYEEELCGPGCRYWMEEVRDLVDAKDHKFAEGILEP